MSENLRTLYPDLMEETDARSQRLVSDLHALFNASVPDAVWTAAVPYPRHGRPSGLRLPRWRTALVIVLGLFALVGATTAIVMPLLQQIWIGDRGLAHVTDAGLTHNLDASQTVGGVTIRLQRAYADANRVAVGYTVELPHTDSGDPQPALAKLTDDAGRQYPPLDLTFGTASPLGAQVWNFAMLEGGATASERNFELTIERVASSKARYEGSWLFRFTLTIAAGRIANPALARTQDGIDFTLTRAVIAPSSTEFDYRITRATTDEGVSGTAQFVVGGRMLGGPGSCDRAGRCTFIAAEPLSDLDTLTIDEITLQLDRPGDEAHVRIVRLLGPFPIPLGR